MKDYNYKIDVNKANREVTKTTDSVPDILRLLFCKGKPVKISDRIIVPEPVHGDPDRSFTLKPSDAMFILHRLTPYGYLCAEWDISEEFY